MADSAPRCSWFELVAAKCPNPCPKIRLRLIVCRKLSIVVVVRVYEAGEPRLLARTCKLCQQGFVQAHVIGRPRQYCYSCQPEGRKLVRLASGRTKLRRVRTYVRSAPAPSQASQALQGAA